MRILQVNNLKVEFKTDYGIVKAVDGISFSLKQREIIAIVGESGCGKSVTAKAILGLIWPPGKISNGQIFYYKNTTKIPLHKLGHKSKQIRSIRGKEISMIFQEPMTALNPVYTVKDQIVESIILHQALSRRNATEVAKDMLLKVGIPAAEERIYSYPHQLSGGIRQRIMIAMALVCRPTIVIADEPTTALDVTIQAQVLELMQSIQREFNMSIILITHDLGVVAEMAERVYVMYLGKIVESSDAKTVFTYPLHPYTQGLLSSIPNILDSKKDIEPIKGNVPKPGDIVSGCCFEPRCPESMDVCKHGEPILKEVTENHYVSCWLQD